MVNDSIVPVYTRELTEEEKLAEKAWSDGAYNREYDVISISRAIAYSAPGGSDGIFFQYQRGEATKQQWLDAVQAINDANPYPVKAK